MFETNYGYEDSKKELGRIIRIQETVTDSLVNIAEKRGYDNRYVSVDNAVNDLFCDIDSVFAAKNVEHHSSEKEKNDKLYSDKNGDKKRKNVIQLFESYGVHKGACASAINAAYHNQNVVLYKGKMNSNL
jgi:hypothetical protein